MVKAMVLAAKVMTILIVIRARAAAAAAALQPFYHRLIGSNSTNKKCYSLNNARFYIFEIVPKAPDSCGCCSGRICKAQTHVVVVVVVSVKPKLMWLL